MIAELTTQEKIKGFITSAVSTLDYGAALTKTTADDSVVNVLKTITANSILLDWAVGYLARWIDSGAQPGVLSVEQLPDDLATRAAAVHPAESFTMPDPTKIFEAIALLTKLYEFIRSFWK